MNNYEKIMLALFAIQHNAYIIQSCNDTALHLAKDDLALRCAFGRDELLAACISKLQDVMEDLGEYVNAMDAMTGVDTKLMEVPYAIVYGRKTPEDYD